MAVHVYVGHACVVSVHVFCEHLLCVMRVCVMNVSTHHECAFVS